MLNFTISKERNTAGFFTLTALAVFDERVINQIRMHPKHDSFHWNICTGKVLLNIWAYTYDEAEMIADWITEDILSSHESIKYQFAFLDELEGIQ